jgi:branched-chain amino acid aminotransferase
MSMADRDGVIWLDGEMVPWREAKVHVLTHTLHYGMGVFEGERIYHTDKGPAIFRLKDHTARLFRSAHIMGMQIPFDQETINAATVAAVRDNKLESGYIRPMAFYGAEGMGLRADNLKTHVMVAAWQWGTYMGEENLRNGIKIRTSSYTRHHVNSMMVKSKTNANYVNSMMALQEAIASGCDEALMLDSEGFVAEGSAENFFLVRDDVIYTPELTSALDGITRNTVIQLAQEQGYTVKEKSITRDEVYVADEAFFTGSAAEVTPIRMLDGRVIGNGGRGPVTERLQSLYFDVVHGRSEAHMHWVTLINS